MTQLGGWTWLLDRFFGPVLGKYLIIGGNICSKGSCEAQRARASTSCAVWKLQLAQSMQRRGQSLRSEVSQQKCCLFAAMARAFFPW